MRNYSDEGYIKIGLGEEVSIGDLTKSISRTVGFNGSLELNTKFPDAPPETPRQ
jgi:GDP-L-fucose synthase